MSGWLIKAENKAKDQHSWRLGLAELGNNMVIFIKMLRNKSNIKRASFLVLLLMVPTFQCEYQWNFHVQMVFSFWAEIHKNSQPKLVLRNKG